MNASKKIKTLLTASLAASAAAVISCNNPSSDALSGSEKGIGDQANPINQSPVYGGQTGFSEAQYFGGIYRTKCFTEYRLHPDPVVTAVSSRAEFEQNFDINANSMSAAIFADSTAKYTDDFFKNNFLIIVSLVEPSGSIRHKVESVGVDDGKIVISRFEEPGPAIFFNWTIVISMKNESKLKEYSVAFNEVLVEPPVAPSVIPPPFYDMSVQYVQTSYGVFPDDYQFPHITIISSTSELQRHYMSTSGIHILPVPYADKYAEILQKYTDDFFKNNFLVAVSLEESSGGTRHKVEKIDANGDIYISRVFGMTDDMAAWNIIIPQSKDSNVDKYNVVLVQNAIAVTYEFEAQYIRTGSSSSPDENPVVISSRAELEQYGHSIPNHFYLYDDAVSNGFAENTAKYTDDFFKTKFLVIVSKTEGSGSIRHEVESVENTGNIVINRLLPGFGTDDIAGWHIVIELSKDGIKGVRREEKYNVKFVDVFLDKITDPPVLSYELDIRYIRTMSVLGDAKNPVIISSKAELEEYGHSIPSVIIDENGVTRNGFTEKVKYTDDFFVDYFLVIVPKGEPSGSIRHEVESVGKDGNIVINRLLPEVGTADIAGWHIIIPQKNYSKLEKYNVVFKDISVLR